MRAMILAAGLGTRMRPLTDHCPKPLLRAGHDSLIGHTLHRLRNAGITDVVINHAWLGDKLEAALGDGANYGVSICYSREGTPLETAGGIVKALPLLCPKGADDDAPFIVVNGDIWTDFDFATLIQAADHMGSNQAVVVLVDNPEHHPLGDFHLSAEGQVQATHSGTKRTFSGIGLYRPSLFTTVSDTIAPLAPLLRSAMAKQRVAGIYHPGRWRDIGTPERLAELDAELTAQARN